jgi:hypothetical protein
MCQMEISIDLASYNLFYGKHLSKLQNYINEQIHFVGRFRFKDRISYMTENSAGLLLFLTKTISVKSVRS